ncbi:MAG: PilZ domain-containing protein [Sphingomicrobium sp.]
MNNIRHQILSGELRERRSLLGCKRTKGADAEKGLTTVEISREVPRTTHMRDDDRHRLIDQQVRVKHKRKTHTVQLVNLSGGGAMIAGDLQPKLWDRVELHLGKDGKIECAVRWLKGGRIGLEFAHETRLDCSEEARATLLKAVVDQNFSDLQIGPSKDRSTDEEAARQAAAAESSDEQRDNRRHPLIWSGVLHYNFASTPVRLRDISQSGALVECQSTLPVGAEPLLDLGDAGSIFGSVTWAIGDHMGLKFHEPFDIQELAKTRPEVTPVEWQAPSYLKTTGPDSPWSDGWERMSVEELQETLEGFLKQ